MGLHTTGRVSLGERETTGRVRSFVTDEMVGKD